MFSPLKFLFRWAFRALILLIVLFVAGVLLLDSVVRAVAERSIRAQTGMDVKIGRFSVGLLSPVVTIEDFKLYNTPEFGGSPFIVMRELHLVYDRRALFMRKLRYRLVRFDLAELNLVINKQGNTNLRALQDGLRKTGRTTSGKEKPGGYKFGGIDTLNLTFDKVTLLSMNNPRQVQELPLGIRNYIVTDIKTSQQLESTLELILAQYGGKALFDFIMGVPAAPQAQPQPQSQPRPNPAAPGARR